MRVNHTGEICAQALYSGQALFARDERVRAALLGAAAEERDHLAWCRGAPGRTGIAPQRARSALVRGLVRARRRLRASRAIAGAWASSPRPRRRSSAISTAISSACRADDLRSRAVVEQMREDENRHGAAGRRARRGRAPARREGGDAHRFEGDDADRVLRLRRGRFADLEVGGDRRRSWRASRWPSNTFPSKA